MSTFDIQQAQEVLRKPIDCRLKIHKSAGDQECPYGTKRAFLFNEVDTHRSGKKSKQHVEGQQACVESYSMWPR